MTATLAGPAGRFDHEALFYRDEEDFLAGLLPFVREGLELDEAVVVAEPRPRLDLLRDALGDDAAAVDLLDMAEVGRNPKDPSILGLVFHSRMIGMFNWTFYKDPKLDAALDQVITIMNLDQRKQMYGDIQTKIMDQALIIPLAETMLVFVLRPEVQGLVVDPRGLPMYLQDVSLKR